MRNRCNGTHGRWWDSSPWLRSSSFTLATVKPSPARRWVGRERRTASIAASAGPRRPARFVGGGVAAEGACEGSLGEEFGEEFGEKAGESPVIRGRSSRPRGVALPAKGAGQSSPRTMFPSVLVCTAHGDPLLSTARTHVRMPLPRRSWAFDQPVLVTFRTFCLAVCAVTALQLLSASGSRWGGHRVPFGNGRVKPCRSDAALLQRPCGGALEGVNFQASLLVHFSAVADNVQPQSGRCCWTSGQAARQWCASVGTTTVRNWPRFRHRSARGPRVRSAACPV